MKTVRDILTVKGRNVWCVDAGATVLPASPGFYGAGAAATAAQLVDFVAGKVLDAAGVPHTLFTRWRGELGAARE